MVTEIRLVPMATVSRSVYGLYLDLKALGFLMLKGAPVFRHGNVWHYQMRREINL